MDKVNINKGHEGVLANAIFFPRSATIFDYTKGGSPLYNNYGEALYHGTLPRWAAEEGIKWIWRIPQSSGSFETIRPKTSSSTLYSTTTLHIKPIANLDIRSQFYRWYYFFRDRQLYS